MAVVLSHNSSLEFLRAIPPQVWIPPHATLDDCVDGPTTCSSELDLSILAPYGIRQLPIHVLTSRSNNRVRRKGFTAHSCVAGNQPEGSLLKLADGLFTSTPELVFVQMASQTSLLGLIVLGCELCGSYSHFSQLISGFYDRPPLTSTQKISLFLEEIPNVNGIQKARRALRWVRDDSRSPMETVVSCELFLPGNMGGWARKAPILNYEVTLDAAASRITKTAKAKIDIAWPELMLGLEYDSESFHQDPAKDLRRREALSHQDWTIFVINLDEIKSWRDLEAKIGLFIDRVPVAPRMQAADVSQRRKLHERLLKATRFGLGPNNALFGIPVKQGEVKIHL